MSQQQSNFNYLKCDVSPDTDTTMFCNKTSCVVQLKEQRGGGMGKVPLMEYI